MFDDWLGLYYEDVTTASAGFCQSLFPLKTGLNSASATTAQQLRLSNYASATTPQQLRISNYASSTTTQQPRLSNHGSATKLGSRFSNYASATTLQQPKLTMASATTLQQPKSTLASATKLQQPKLTPSGKHIQSHILHVISKSNPSGKYMHSLILHVISNPTPSGKYMHSLILHVISKFHPLWQAHTKSHLTVHMKILPPLASTYKVTSYGSYENPTPLASTCTVSSYTSYQNFTPSGKYMHSLILHVISNPTPSGKYMHSLILHVISKFHPLWQAHTKSHLTVHMKILPPLASTYKVTSYGSYENPTPSGRYMHSLILHVISKFHPLWQVHAQSHLTRHIKIPPPLASTRTATSHITRSKSHPLWQVHARSHLTRHIKIPPPLASTCAVSSYTSYQNPTPSGKYMQSHILHVISKSHPLWQVHAQSHLARLRILVYET